MNDLPSSPPPPQPISTGSINKESEVGGPPSEVSFRPTGQEVELSPEVISSGVTVQPTSIPIPPSVTQMGVAAVGQNVMPAPPAVTLPLSDDQIEEGLKKSVSSSWRWMAEWCVRKLKQLHMGLKIIHGKLTRVRE
jgi:hypothetical protein